jgi:Mitochondrial carrier protein
VFWLSDCRLGDLVGFLFLKAIRRFDPCIGLPQIAKAIADNMCVLCVGIEILCAVTWTGGRMGDQKQGSVWKAIKPFVNGGLSGIGATCIIQPIDMVKVRLQLGATGSPVSPPG